MKIIKFTINNYRAIENVDLNLNYSINPIIGVNESGKTSVLNAILAFDKERDNYNQGEHLNPQNKYSTKDTQNSFVQATITLDKDEIDSLIKYTKIKTDSLDYNHINSFSEKTQFQLKRLLKKNSQEYVLIDENISIETKNRICKYLHKNLPYILYFDDFTDRVPEMVEFPKDYISNGKLPRSRIRDWQEIIEEIFRRADAEGIDDDNNPLQKFMQIDDRHRKKGILSDVQDMLDKEIIKEWKRIKNSGKTMFADDSDKLELEIDNPVQNSFQFVVIDKSNMDKGRPFNVIERSKGFQWFFNYMIKLKFNPNYKKKKENSIFLLDEPGSYLHSSAQSELLKELDSVSKHNTIIYCTHSQYLLNPNIIKLGSIRIAEKDESKIKLHDYGKYKSKKDKGALSPVYQALQLNFAHDFIGNMVITEGITDYYFFTILQNHSSLIDKSIKFIPGMGAGQSSTLISLAIPFSDDFIIFLDNDEAGRKAKKQYIKEFGEQIESKIHFYNKEKENFVLENLLSETDKNRLLEITQSVEIKRAFGFLFYDYRDKQKEFIIGIDEITKKNIFQSVEKLKQFISLNIEQYQLVKSNTD